MTSLRPLLWCLLPLAFTGCAIHPLPEDYEGNSTVKIVEHIRCEARRSIQDNAIGFLRNEGNNKLADELEADRSGFKKFKISRLRNQDERDFYKRYIMTGLALGFTLDITEDNAASTQLDFLKLISNGTVSLNASASSDRQREASRQFLTTDTFKKLLDDDMVCLNNPDAIPLAPNFVYPVTGSIGLAELIGTFIQLNEEQITLSPSADKAPVFADTLNFTTTFTGSVTPKVALAPAVGHRFQLADATLVASASRKDANKVIVGLSLAPATTKDKGARGIVGPSLVPNLGLATVFAKRNISESELLAVQAISQTRIDTYYDRSVQVAAP